MNDIVKHRIKIHEINGNDTGVPIPYLTICNHCNYESLVKIKFDDKEYTVSARELDKAIRNATNWKAY